LRKKLADSEKARMELEMRLRQMERTKMELVQELAKWIGGEQKMVRKWEERGIGSE
jgi:hypothetical protein